MPFFSYKKTIPRVSTNSSSSSSSNANILSPIYNIIKSFSNIIIKTLSDKNEICLIFINIIIFMVIQTIFFYTVVSKEYEVLLKEKLNTVNYYLSQDANIKDYLIDLKNDEKNIKKLNEIKKKADEQKKVRERANQILYWYYCFIPILCVLFLFVVLIFLFIFTDMFKSEESFTITKILNYFLVFFVYTPEIIVFLYVIKKYQYIGNIDILSIIYNKLNKE
jgi:hypothetical protein